MVFAVSFLGACLPTLSARTHFCYRLSANRQGQADFAGLDVCPRFLVIRATFYLILSFVAETSCHCIKQEQEITLFFFSLFCWRASWTLFKATCPVFIFTVRWCNRAGYRMRSLNLFNAARTIKQVTPRQCYITSSDTGRPITAPVSQHLPKLDSLSMSPASLMTLGPCSTPLLLCQNKIESSPVSDEWVCLFKNMMTMIGINSRLY